MLLEPDHGFVEKTLLKWDTEQKLNIFHSSSCALRFLLQLFLKHPVSQATYILEGMVGFLLE